MASIGWQGMSIAVTAVLIVGCGGLLLLAREIAHDAICQPRMIEPVKHRRVVVHSKVASTALAQEDKHVPQDTTDTGREVEEVVLIKAASEGLTRARIVEELDPADCWCAQPRLDRAYLISARECSFICACVNENDPWISPRVELFPAE